MTYLVTKDKKEKVAMRKYNAFCKEIFPVMN
jgi:hypothetical protein